MINGVSHGSKTWAFKGLGILPGILKDAAFHCPWAVLCNFRCEVSFLKVFECAVCHCEIRPEKMYSLLLGCLELHIKFKICFGLNYSLCCVAVQQARGGSLYIKNGTEVC